MSLTTRVLLALVLGLGVGVAVSASGSPRLAAAALAIEPVGTLFVNAIRMTVIPLVVSSLIVGVGGVADPRDIGRVGARAVALFLALLAAGAAFAFVVAPPLLRLVPVAAEASAALRAGASTSAAAAREGAARIPSVGQWLVDLVPVNPLRAAADGAMLPLIVFAVLFGLAVSRLAAERRAPLIGVLGAVADASVTLVGWVLTLAPVGVFALAVPLATRHGAAVAGALASYVAVTALACTLFTALVLYPVAWLLGRVPLLTFARAALPSQAVAFSSRSSLASLPAMMDASRTRLGLPEPVTTFFLPLAASTFRVGGAVGQTIALLFIARLYGIEIDPGRMLTVMATLVVMTFSVPGVPAGAVVGLVPVLGVAGIPVEGAGLVLGVDAIPDMFRTTTNVTGDLAAATVLGRDARRDPSDAPGD